ncbi:MAG TPA: hypothetical protein VE782_06440 [Myxococcaceae bacterium]|nr:hypothetical protein [Myxococcaceae bacterium]
MIIPPSAAAEAPTLAIGAAGPRSNPLRQEPLARATAPRGADQQVQPVEFSPDPFAFVFGRCAVTPGNAMLATAHV